MGLIDILTTEQQLEYRIRANEATYQVIDKVTRRTGRLTKVTYLMDETNLALSNLSRKAMQQDAELNKELGDYWPQMVGSFYIFNAPSFVNRLWKVAKHIFPKR